MAGRLGDILVSRGLISKEDLQAALSSLGGQRGVLGEMFVARGFINSQQFGEAFPYNSTYLTNRFRGTPSIPRWSACFLNRSPASGSWRQSP